MKTHRKTWPQVREYQKRGKTYFAVDMRRAGYNGQKWKHCPSKDAALKYAKEIEAKVTKLGLTSINRLNEDPRIKVWEGQLAIYNHTIEEAINLALGIYRKEFEAKQSPFIAELLTLWVDDKETNKLNPLRATSLRAIRGGAERFKESFQGLRMSDMSKERVETFLVSRGQSNIYRKNLRNYLGQFFNWAIKKGYWKDNPCKNIEITIERGSPKFLSVEESRKVMGLAVKHNMVAYYSLCLFAGVRPDEALRMTWDNIKLETKEIVISRDISKVKKDRLFKMNHTLYSWLKTLDQTKPLHFLSWDRARRTVKKEFGKWTQDILRHTFATYTYAIDPTHNLNELSHIMGNSTSIIETFYKGVISETTCKDFFGILPDSFKE